MVLLYTDLSVPMLKQNLRRGLMAELEARGKEPRYSAFKQRLKRRSNSVEMA